MKKLFLLDGMALAYRAHFALIRSPIFNSKGMNTSAAYGFTATLIDLIQKQQPTHLAIAFDTSAPTARHELHPEYKANREAMPEDLSIALPYIETIAEGFNIPIIKMDGYEADDIIGTLAQKAENEGFDSLVIKELEEMGHAVHIRGKLGKVEAVKCLDNGNLEGAADTRANDDVKGF